VPGRRGGGDARGRGDRRGVRRRGGAGGDRWVAASRSSERGGRAPRGWRSGAWPSCRQPCFLCFTVWIRILKAPREGRPARRPCAHGAVRCALHPRQTQGGGRAARGGVARAPPLGGRGWARPWPSRGRAARSKAQPPGDAGKGVRGNERHAVGDRVTPVSTRSRPPPVGVAAVPPPRPTDRRRRPARGRTRLPRRARARPNRRPPSMCRQRAPARQRWGIQRQDDNTRRDTGVPGGGGAPAPTDSTRAGWRTAVVYAAAPAVAPPLLSAAREARTARAASRHRAHARPRWRCARPRGGACPRPCAGRRRLPHPTATDTRTPVVEGRSPRTPPRGRAPHKRLDVEGAHAGPRRPGGGGDGKRRGGCRPCATPPAVSTADAAVRAPAQTTGRGGKGGRTSRPLRASGSKWQEQHTAPRGMRNSGGGTEGGGCPPTKRRRGVRSRGGRLSFSPSGERGPCLGQGVRATPVVARG